MMKKTLFLAAVAALLFGACQGGGGVKMGTGASSEAHLEDDVDTICYVIGNLTASGVKMQALSKEDRGMGIDSVYFNEFMKGVATMLNGNLSEREQAYTSGIYIGYQLKTFIENTTRSQLYGREDTTHVINTRDFLAGLLDGINEKPCRVPGNEIFLEGMVREKMDRIAMEAKIQRNAGYKQENDDFLKQIAQKEGVKELCDGIYYEVLTEGNGETPTEEQIVRVHYEGKTIDGNVFDSSFERGEPIELIPTQVIAGWTKALVNMPVGSKWIVYIPYDQAYGEDTYGPIKGFSTLIFTIELLGIVEE